MKKRISIQELRPGMFIAGLDQSWFQTPFLRHQWKIKREDEISLLRHYGIQEVVIDTERGIDIAPDTPTLNSVNGQEGAQESTTPLTSDWRPDPEELELARVIRAEAISTLDVIFHQMEAPTPQHLTELRSVVSTLFQGILEHQAAMVSLIQMRRFDPDLASHGVDTGVLAMAMGKEMDYAPPELKLLGLAALLHDVGQLRLPLNLLRKIHPFSPQDHKLIQVHCEIGERLLNAYPEIPQKSKTMVLNHHERIDGSGYPNGLRGSQISESTQILSIADAYDAQISGRCSHPPVPPARALSELYKAAVAGQYQTSLVQQLIQLLGVYPIGSLVRLNTGEQAIVVWVNHHSRMTPTIKLLKDSTGQSYQEQEIIDLSSQIGNAPPRSIAEALDPNLEGEDISHILESLW